MVAQSEDDCSPYPDDAYTESIAGLLDAIDRYRAVRAEMFNDPPGVNIWFRMNDSGSAPEVMITSPDFPAGIAADDPRVPAVLMNCTEEKRRRILDHARIRERLRTSRSGEGS